MFGRGVGLELDLRGWSGFEFGPWYGVNLCTQIGGSVGWSGIG